MQTALSQSASTAASNSQPGNRSYVGRQPIFDPVLEVHAYELLFRSGEKNFAAYLDGDEATANVLLNTFTEIGLDTIVGSKLAFVNLTRNLVVGNNLSCLPTDRVVLEILEDIRPDAAVLNSVQRLSEQGYRIALDDFVFHDDLKPLIELADIVKIEYPAIPNDQLAIHIEQLREMGIKTILAEKLETQEDFERCRELGCDLFQGYFFSKPQVISGHRTDGNVASIVRLVTELQNPEIKTSEVEQIIQTDADLSYKLLRFVNSAHAATQRTIESLKQATALMGIQRLRSLAAMMLMTGINSSKPKELTNLAMTRAKMCELLAERRGERRSDRFYTLGLFSVLDAMLDQPMAELLERLPLADEMNDALLNRQGALGKVLASVVDFEQGRTSDHAEISFGQVSAVHEATLIWIAKNGAVQ